MHPYSWTDTTQHTKLVKYSITQAYLVLIIRIHILFFFAKKNPHTSTSTSCLRVASIQKKLLMLNMSNSIYDLSYQENLEN